MVELARAGRTHGRTGLTTAEREELIRLRKEVRILAEEREILKKWSCAATHPRRDESGSVCGASEPDSRSPLTGAWGPKRMDPNSILVIDYCILRDDVPFADLGAGYFDRMNSTKAKRYHLWMDITPVARWDWIRRSRCTDASMSRNGVPLEPTPVIGKVESRQARSRTP